MKKFDEYPILAVTSDDESYPFGMRKMSNNSVIYYKGNINLINATKNIAVIGTEKYRTEVVNWHMKRVVF